MSVHFLQVQSFIYEMSGWELRTICSAVCSAFHPGLSLLPEEGTSWSHMGWGGVCVSSASSPIPFWFSVLEHTLSHKTEKCPVFLETTAHTRAALCCVLTLSVSTRGSPCTSTAKSVFPCDTETQLSPVCPVFPKLWEGGSYSGQGVELSLVIGKGLLSDDC